MGGVAAVLRSPWTKVVVWAVCLAPLAVLLWRYKQDDLTANPIEFLTHETGTRGLQILLASLAITPLRRLTGWLDLIRFRRLLGLFAFFYGMLHFLVWFCLDRFFDWHEMINDVLKRRFITVGMIALVVLLALAATSTKGMIRKLGRNWGRLHKTVYVAAALVVVHYWWLVKSDIRRPAFYGAVLVGLLGLRMLKGKKVAVRS